MMPIGGNADRGIVEARAGSWIERPGQPVSKQDGAESNPLIAGGTEGQQEEEGVSQADLGQRVFKSEVGLAAVERAEKDAQQRSAASDLQMVWASILGKGVPFRWRLRIE